MTTTFNFDPYYDDFNEDENFMRVLFRPGYAVQARELTQLQTILSNQIEKFGNHIFKSGSPIIGGKISLDDKANYIILRNQYNNLDIVPENFLDKTIVSFNSTKSARAKVIAIDVTDSTAPVLVLKYLSGETFTENDELKVFGQNIFAQVRATNALGNSYVASIQDGVYYFRGQFVKVVPQFLVLELFYKIGANSTVVSNQPTYKVGIEFTENIIDEVDDTSLLDPAQGSFNYQAPGAARFQLDTTLSKRTIDSSDESSFFEVIRLVNGVKTKEIEYPIYSEIEKTLARGTYDESGNYTVDPFVISLEEGDIANGKFNIVLDPGKAYVGGYEFQTIAPTTIEIDRARTTSNVIESDLPTNYTSYVALGNIAGTLDITTFPLLDIHCVQHNLVDASTDAKYNSTKIGTTRANMIKYNDSSNSNLGNTHTFTVNVFDVLTLGINGNVATGSTNTVINLPSTFSNTPGANAYANMLFRLTDSGNTSISPILISESDGSARTITLSQALPITPNTNNSFSIDADFRFSNSMITKSGTAKLFRGDVDSDSKDSNGFSYINEPSRTSLIFDVPYEAIKADSIDNYDFFARKIYTNKLSDGAGKITLSTEGTDTFAFAGTPGTLSDSVILNNIICFIRSDSASNTTSGITPNTVLSLANNLFTVTAVNSTTVDIQLNTVGVRADIIATSRINNAENGSTGAIRGKQLIPLTSGANLHAKVPYELNPGGDTLAAANSTIKTTFTDGTVFNDIGATWFESNASLVKLRTPGVAVSLQVPDVYEIVRITDSLSPSANVTTAMLTSSANDVTNNYEFDNGQKKTHYDHATIKLKRGFSSPKGKVLVQYKYLKHQSAPSPQNDGLFTVDSYLKSGSNFTYDDISVFVNKDDEKTTQLRSAFDFRPTRAIAGDTLSGAVNPDPDLTGVVNFQYFLGRIDQVVVKPSREFFVVQGKSAISPTPSPVSPEDMLIYKLTIPAYTESVADVRADFTNNRRYTMKDIGAFDSRIKGLEYYVALNSLERNASSSKILDSNGLERSKYGILVDNFSTTDTQATYTDVGNDNRCLIENGELKAASLMRTFPMRWVESLSSGPFNAVGTNTKKTLMLDYTTSEFAKQKYATKELTVAGALFGNFSGSVKLYPEFAADVDTEVTAKVTLNSTQGIEEAFTFINDALKRVADKTGLWTTDRDNPFSKISTNSWYTSSSVSSVEQGVLLKAGHAHGGEGAGFRGNILTTTDSVYFNQNYNLQQQSLTTSESQVDVGSFVTDLAIMPYIKGRMITFAGESLRPNTRYYTYFDGVNVDNFIAVPDKVTLNVSSGFSSGEISLIANTTSDLAANLASYLSGGSAYDAVIITTKEPNTNTAFIINETGKTLVNKFIIGLDNGRVAVINSVIEHRSGKAVSNTSNGTITLSPDAPSVDITGNTIFLVHQTGEQKGLGVPLTISSYNVVTKSAVVNGGIAGFPNSYTYTFGANRSNEYGQVSGVFYVPEATFRSGERKFRLTQSFNNTFDTDSISFAEHTFVSSGLKLNKTNLVDTVLNVGIQPKVVGSTTETTLVSQTTTSQVIATWQDDPLAQTFFVDPQVYPYGVFLDNVDLFFKDRDRGNIPIRVQIRPTINGAPHTDFWYPESIVTKYPNEINISDNPLSSDAADQTNFKFQFPVFLKPGLYALVVLTDSPDYQMWVAEKGQLTTRGENVSQNPYIGTLYKSQNSMEYVPIINEDMMFTLNRCVFSTGLASFVLESEPQSRLYNIDKFRLLQTTINPLSDAPITVNHSFLSKPVGQTKESSYREFLPDVTYSMGQDELYVVGDRRKELQDQGDFTVKIDMSTTTDAISPVISLESIYLNAWENFIDNAALSNEDFNILASGTGYSNSNTITVTSSTGSGAEVFLVVDGANGNVVSVNVASGGSGYTDDFTMTIDSSTGTGATIVLNSEFDESGGPSDAKYITKPIVLADGFDAGDLRVFLAGNKQGSSEIEVFYKLLSSTDATPFNERIYQKMVCVNPTTTPSKTNGEYRDYEYRPSATVNAVSYVSNEGVVYDTFKTFSIKIVMISTDPAIVPKVKDLRIIALPAE